MNYVFKHLTDLDITTAMETGIPPTVMIDSANQPLGVDWRVLTAAKLFDNPILTPSSGDYIRVPVYSYNAFAKDQDELTCTWIAIGSIFSKLALETKLKEPCVFVFIGDTLVIGDTLTQETGYQLWIGVAIRGYA